jgi:hypothetical protein
MLKQTDSNYFVVGNLTFNKDELKNLPNQEITEIEIEFPTSFKYHRPNRFIKVLGCSLTYLAYDGAEDSIKELVYNPLHTTLHSNIINPINTDSAIDKTQLLLDSTKDPPSHINDYTQYLLTVNNYFTQKMFKIPDFISKLKFHFIDEQGEKVKILSINHYEGDIQNPQYLWYLEDPDKFSTFVNEPPTIKAPFIHIFQALFKIEMELIKG